MPCVVGIPANKTQSCKGHAKEKVLDKESRTSHCRIRLTMNSWDTLGRNPGVRRLPLIQ